MRRVSSSELAEKFVASVVLCLAIVLFFGSIVFTKEYADYKALSSAQFVDAKAEVSDAYNVLPNDVSLYKYNTDSCLWENIMDTEALGDYCRIYPRGIYSAEIDGEEKILAVQLYVTGRGLSILNSEPIEICGKNAAEYPMSIQEQSDGTLVTINVADIDNISEIISGIDIGTHLI